MVRPPGRRRDSADDIMAPGYCRPICRAIPGECPAPPALSTQKCTHKCVSGNAKKRVRGMRRRVCSFIPLPIIPLPPPAFPGFTSIFIFGGGVSRAGLQYVRVTHIGEDYFLADAKHGKKGLCPLNTLMEADEEFLFRICVNRRDLRASPDSVAAGCAVVFVAKWFRGFPGSP